MADEWITGICIRYGAEIVALYDQEEDPRIANDPLTSSGWCLGMVVGWLRCKRLRKDFWQWQATPDGESVFRQVMAAQRLAVQPISGSRMGGAVAWMERDNLIVKKMSSYGFALATITDEHTHSGARSFTYNAIMGAGRHIIVQLRNSNGGAHAIGILIGTYSITLFDPNCGEFAVQPKSNFAGFLAAFNTCMGYGRYDNYALLKFS